MNTTTKVVEKLNGEYRGIALHAGDLKDAIYSGRLQDCRERVLNRKRPDVPMQKYFGSDDFIYDTLIETGGVLITKDVEFAFRYRERTILLYDGPVIPDKRVYPDGEEEYQRRIPKSLHVLENVAKLRKDRVAEDVLILVKQVFGDELAQFCIHNGKQNGKKEEQHVAPSSDS